MMDRGCTLIGYLLLVIDVILSEYNEIQRVYRDELFPGVCVQQLSLRIATTVKRRDWHIVVPV